MVETTVRGDTGHGCTVAVDIRAIFLITNPQNGILLHERFQNRVSVAARIQNTDDGCSFLWDLQSAENILRPIHLFCRCILGYQ